MALDERPAVTAEWATTAVSPNIDSAPSEKIETGWFAGEAPPHNWFNFLQKNFSDWIRYLDGITINLGILNWERSLGSAADGAFEGAGGDVAIIGAGNDPVSKQWLAVGGSEGCSRTRDDGQSFEAFRTGMASGVDLTDVSFGATSSAVCVGFSATMYQRATILSGSWGTVTAPGTPVTLRSIVYDTSNSRHIVVGEKAANAPYIANGDNATGTAFTDRSGAIPGGWASKGLGSIAVNDVGVAVVGTETGTTHTKLLRTGDGGTTWADSTTTLVDAHYQVTWSPLRQRFFAVRMDNAVTQHVYSSADGLVWTLVFSGVIGFNGSVQGHDNHGVASHGHALVVCGSLDARSALGISLDGGLTWDIHLPIEEANDVKVVGSRTASKLLAFDGVFGVRCARIAHG